MPQERVFVGIDVAKDRLDVHVLDGEVFAVGNSCTGRRQLVARLTALPGEVAAGLEASGGYEIPVLQALATAGVAVWRLDAARVRAFGRSIGAKAKTDAIDASVIARCLKATIDTVPAWRPDPEVARLAALVRFRSRLAAELAALKLRDDRTDEPLIDRIVQGKLRATLLAIAELDHAILALITQVERLHHHARLLKSAPGVGPVLAAALIAELPELGSVSSRQAAALVGVAPYDRQSGRRQRARRCAGGRSHLRKILYMAVLAAIRAKQANPFKTTYHRLKTAGKAAKVAIVAVMRKVIVTLNTMIRNNTAWAP